MIGFTATLKKFGQQGEKTGWTYISVPATIANKIKPGNKKSFRVKGSIDACTLKSVALLPMGGGDFIIPVNASMRKIIRKPLGSKVEVEMEEDTKVVSISKDLRKCLAEEPEAKAYFESLAKSHQQYYSKWIEQAKTVETKSRRIAAALHAFTHKLSYSEMMHWQKSRREI
ncbi:MAG: DUF1905 domain-containing protein [Bacteroidetes bacterium]|nr:DUF1905 domain-containing protein [Bacteroidota bacterium]